MDFDKATELFNDLKRKISDERDYLSQNEYRTRIVLVDPVLRILGWNVDDPASVHLEYEVGRERADYALMSNDNPVAVIEAKKLGTQLEEREKRQVFNYAITHGIRHMAVTNGDDWLLYDVFPGEPRPREECIIMEFSLRQMPAHECVLKSLRLWKPNISSNDGPIEAPATISHRNVVEAASIRDQTGVWPSSEHSTEAAIQNPTANYTAMAPSSRSRRPMPRSRTRVNSRSVNRSDVGTSDEWHSLGDESWFGSVTGKKPQQIKIEEQIETVLSWKEFAHHVVIWLVRSGRLQREDCPVSVTRSGERSLVNTSPVHPDGVPFSYSVELPEGMYMYTVASASQHLGQTRRLLEKYGVDPSVVQLLLR